MRSCPPLRLLLLLLLMSPVSRATSSVDLVAILARERGLPISNETLLRALHDQQRVSPDAAEERRISAHLRIQAFREHAANQKASWEREQSALREALRAQQAAERRLKHEQLSKQVLELRGGKKTSRIEAALLGDLEEQLRQIEEAVTVEEQQQMETISIPGRRREAVVVAAQRSGSTLLVSLLSVVTGAFVLPEPYNQWEVHAPLPGQAQSKSAPPMPSISRLLDCSFARTQELTSHVFWAYACLNSLWIARNETLRLSCSLFGNLLSQTVLDKCMSAPLNVIKTVRVPLLRERFGEREAIPAAIRVVHLVRKPWDVFLSQRNAGFFVDEQLPYRNMVPAGVDAERFHMTRICKHIMLNHRVTSSRSTDNRMILRYEDLTRAFDSVITSLFSFLDIGMDDAILGLLRKVRSRRYAMFSKVAQDGISREAAIELAKSIEECQMVAIEFEYEFE